MAEKVLESFRKFDANGDGIISPDELKILLTSLYPEAKYEALIEAADTNKDGQIDYLEFVQWLFQDSPEAKLTEYLPGKLEDKRGFTLTGELARRWDALLQEVEASSDEYSELESKGAFCGIPWASEIAVPKAYWERGAAIEKTELRAITLSQLNSMATLVHKLFQDQEYHDKYSGQAITWDNVNMYHINQHIVKPLSARFKCSFVDLVASGEQRPIWFISHWWGTPFKETIALLNWHAKRRNLTIAVTYWICTFANNQHCLEELAGDLTDTPFVKAISDPRCVGTLALFDAKATTFSRVWCILEGHFSTMEVKKSKPGFLYDLAGMLVRGFKGACLRMDMGDGDAVEHCEGNTVFPGIISKAAMHLRVQEADASVPADKRQILHYIAGTLVELRSEEPPQEHPRYEELNHHMRRGFAGPGLIKAMKDADTAGMRAILKEFPEAVYFESKRAGSIREIANRCAKGGKGGKRGKNSEVVAIIEAAFSEAGSA